MRAAASRSQTRDRPGILLLSQQIRVAINSNVEARFQTCLSLQRHVGLPRRAPLREKRQRKRDYDRKCPTCCGRLRFTRVFDVIGGPLLAVIA